VLPFWVSLLLVLAIGYYAARVIWLLVPAGEPARWSPPPFSGAPAAGGSAVDQSAYAIVSQAHLFGEARPDEPSLANVQEAPETQLNLQLRGAVAALDERFAHAIIADGAGSEKVYFLKDPIPGGAVLQQVQADRVIISRGGVLEALLLPKISEGGSGASTVQRPAFQPMARRNTSPSMQDVVTQNAGGIMEIIRPQPFMPNGELKGYRIYPGRNRDQFAGLGLQPGDLVTEINGMTLNNPSQAMELFRSLANTTSITVTLERAGQAQTLTLDTAQVATAAPPPAADGSAEGAAQ